LRAQGLAARFARGFSAGHDFVKAKSLLAHASCQAPRVGNSACHKLKFGIADCTREGLAILKKRAICVYKKHLIFFFQLRMIRLVQEPVGSLTSSRNLPKMAANSPFFSGKLFRN
jgi:hypothetical protein